MEHSKKTDFGFQTVAWSEKTDKVRGVFESVAPKYDIMNDVLSFGLHRMWKREAVLAARVHAEDHILDLAGGTGDMTRLMYPKIKNAGYISLCDINASMLSVGRARLLDDGFLHRIQYIQADAESLPFADNNFHIIMMAFGLRNVTDKEKALHAIYRVCKPGGRVVILEFSHCDSPVLQKMYDWYSFQVMPKLGAWIADDASSYQYLAESIRRHPRPEVLADKMRSAGFEDVTYRLMHGGVVALHIGYKY